MLKALALSALCGCVCAAPAIAADITVHYLRRETVMPPTLSNLDPVPADLGLRGAQLALEDNRTTGRFLGQTWTLDTTSVAPEADLTAAAQEALGDADLLLIDAPAADLLAAADLPEAAQALIFNVSAPDPALRSGDCRANVLHTAASRAMLSDALMQFFVARRWTDVAVIVGEGPGDSEQAEALDRSATKFGLRLGARKTWAFDADMRRSAGAEVPLFTQDLGDYDVLLIADARNDFARYIPYNTWLPRPTAGAEGLTAKAWDSVVEQFGAAQLQARFAELTGRDMRSDDYAAWAALRAIGEAVTRTGAADAATLRAYMLGPEFELGGFKGAPLTFRTWNGQMRQPIPLTHRGALVAQAPLDGFLHQRNPLDSLGLDAPESACAAFD
ncbi:ABC transporter substrate-binding protein [Primorskyibacter sp. 2E107]|uniref:ABC transporter substrate-binding protein n=1 Tax=Primorskyibacter sp. 2E107 TaxID=3403458 RepID=UPI003AF834E5